MYQTLKNLSTIQQVGVMFTIVFGLLLLASLSLFLLSMREHEDAQSQQTHLDRMGDYSGLLRTSWLMIFVFWLAWLAGDVTRLVLFALGLFFALREFLTLSPTRRGDHRGLVLAFFVVLFLVLVVQTCMVTQHLVARNMGHPPAAPQISRSFTWRSWGMAAGSLLGALLAGITPFVPGQAFALSLVACAAGSLGHLVMKALKRDRGIPIWRGAGKAVTGAGGMLDRIDSLCFAAPVFFHSVR